MATPKTPKPPITPTKTTPSTTLTAATQLTPGVEENTHILQYSQHGSSARRRVIDTSAWIEWLLGSASGQQLALEIPEQENCIVPTIVQLELCKWLNREVSEEAADRMLAYTVGCAVVPLDTRVAVLAAELHREHKLATADAIVYASAHLENAELLTCDAHFKNLPDVLYYARR